MRRPVLHIAEILAWADDFHRHVGRWPRRDDGKIVGQLGLTWCAVDQALTKGHRGLPRGSSLAKLLLRHRGVRHLRYLPTVRIKQLLEWADAHHARTNDWPSCDSGPILGAPGETWMAVHAALRAGLRGLPGGSSLPRLLAQRRGVRNYQDPPRLTAKLVLRWADAYHVRTGTWPIRTSGRVLEAPEESWHAIDAAFVAGSRGLTGYGSLAQFLAKRRGVRNRKALPKLSVKAILAWAAAFYKRTGRWPRHTDGPIEGAPGETWNGVHTALCRANRGLPGGSSLYRLLRRLRRRRLATQQTRFLGRTNV